MQFHSLKTPYIPKILKKNNPNINSLMKKLKFLSLATVAGVSAAMCGCSTDVIDMPTDAENAYTKAFIEEFGLPDPNHDWSLATTAGLTVKTEKPVHLRVLADIDGERYLFADLQGFHGKEQVPVVIPKAAKELILEVDGAQMKCDPNADIDLDSPKSRSYFEVGNEYIVNDQPSLTINEGNAYQGRVIAYLTEDNPEILKVLETPWESEYLIKDKDGNSRMPKIDILLTEDNDDDLMGDFEVAPILIKTPWPEETQLFDIGLIGSGGSQPEHSNMLSFPNIDETFGIGYYNSQIDSEHRVPNNFVTKDRKARYFTTSYVHASNNKIKYETGISYWLKRLKVYDTDHSADDASFRYSHTFSKYNFSDWGTSASFDTYVDGVQNAYCSCYYFENVPFKYYVEGDESNTLHETTVFVYGLFSSPYTPAEEINPLGGVDAFIIEFSSEEDTNNKMKHARITHGGIPEHTWNWRIMAEDLGSVGDWDFNDLVVDFSHQIINCPYASDGVYADKNYTSKFNTNHKITVTPRAAGGTLPIYLVWNGNVAEPYDLELLAGMKVSELIEEEISQTVYGEPQHGEKYENNFIIGKELHSWLGNANTSTMINTRNGITNTGESVTFYFSSIGSNLGSYVEINKLFSVIVDNDGVIEPTPLSENTPGVYTFNKDNFPGCTVIALPDSETNSNVPQMFMVDQRFNWAKETIHINEAYTGFPNWVEIQDTGDSWFDTQVESNVVK